MLAQSNISYKQLYQLFGYRKEMELERIFDALLYSISEINPDNLHYAPATATPYNEALPFLADVVYLYPELKKARYSLPQYLGKRYSPKRMQQINGQLKKLDQVVNSRRQTPWYRWMKRQKLSQKIAELGSEKIDIQTVFQFFDYRAKEEKINRDALHCRFKTYAETFPIEQI